MTATSVTVTFFTPTYNRAYIIKKLYDSLCKQSCRSFEWLIVDDGSTDNTKEVIDEFMEIATFSIRYFYQENSGKHIAINRGVRESKGELFFIVDSDDYLSEMAVERIQSDYKAIIGDTTFCGLSYLRAYHDGKAIGGEVNYSTLDCNLLDYKLRYKIKGDKAEIYKTEILKEYPFPQYTGERFCPEALVFNRIALKYKLRHINAKIYYCEYLPDGLTAKIVKVRMDCVQASLAYYRELYQMDIPYTQKVKTAINYCRFALCAPCDKWKLFFKYPQLGIIVYPIAICLHVRDLARVTE